MRGVLSGNRRVGGKSDGSDGSDRWDGSDRSDISTGLPAEISELFGILVPSGACTRDVHVHLHETMSVISRVPSIQSYRSATRKRSPSWLRVKIPLGLFHGN